MLPLRNICIIIFSFACQGAAAQLLEECGTLENAYGPFDYTNPHHISEKLNRVERAHFTKSVESLLKGQSSTIPVDIDYTLRSFPNHHRALNAMMRYQLLHTRHSTAKYFSIECYFKRAILFKPDDGIVRMIYGIYYHRKGEPKKALEQYKEALRYNPDQSGIHYNLGLLYLKIGDYASAKEHAIIAYKNYYPLPALKNQLIELKIWDGIADIESDTGNE